jgi:anti-sigma B factor antagonist
MDEKAGVEITIKGNVAVVAFRATSISNVEGITAAAEQIREFIEKKRPKKIIFDFGGVKFFSSQVLGVLLDNRARLETYNGEVMISAIDPQLYRVFKITNLNKIFRFFPDKESAVRAAIAN